jgi:hypothetical protein
MHDISTPEANPDESVATDVTPANATNEDKRQAVTRFLTDEESGKWKDREIARRCNVSRHFVAKVRVRILQANTRDIEPIDYESIKALAAVSMRPAATLIALTSCNDPFYVMPGRQAAAEWFAALWREHCQHRSQMHVRGIHYLLISLANPPNNPRTTMTYENTDQCYAAISEAARDARLLGLVPFERIVDERNDVPVEDLPNYSETDGPASVAISDEPVEIDIESLDAIDGVPPALIDEPIEPLRVLGLTDPPDLIEMPAEIEAPGAPDVDAEVDIDLDVSLRPPRITPPWFHVELWCEKTTMNSILLAIARERRLNVITGPGFQSLTGAWRLIGRAKRSGRPVRILYVSDFDKAGQHMPVAVARQVEFIIRRDNLDLDIQLIPVALTHEQCIEYDLPRTPLKDSVRGKEAFEARYGEGATELDALEAIHPGELRRILLRKIDRYADPTFPDRMQEAEERLQDELDDICADVVTPYEQEIAALTTAPDEIVVRRDAEIDSVVGPQVDALNTRIAEMAGGPVDSMNLRLGIVREEAAAFDDEIQTLYAPRIVALNATIDEVRHEAEALDAEIRETGETGIAEINATINAIDERYQAEIADVCQRVEDVRQAIRTELDTETTSALDGAEWPTPQEVAGAVPLFDSRRPYIEQIDVYKKHLGKPTARVKRDDSGLKRKRVLPPREGRS